MTFRFNPYYLINAIVIGTPLLFTITYLIAASSAHVPWCIPPLQGCTTITATGIYPPGSYVFRFGAYPLIAFMGFLFYFFNEWLERITSGRSRLARATWYLASVACLFMTGALAVMDPINQHQWMPIHTVFAISFFVLMLVAQSLYTWEDFKLRRMECRAALAIRVATNLLQLGLLVSALLSSLIGREFNPKYEWLITLSFFLWYSSFLFERRLVFTENFKPR
jgi:hypothetical protein